MKIDSIQPKHVDFIPRELENGILYISKQFGTASHLCCCGCGTKIVTPLRETEYSLIERNRKISLRPSIGNWNHPCQSHYFITDNRVVWATKMSPEQILRGRTYDEALKEAYFIKIELPWWKRIGNRLKSWIRDLAK